MKKLFEKFKMRDKGTIIRTILQVLAYANQIVAVIGQTSFAENQVYQWISLGITIAITLVSYWYNNNWTSMAKLGEDVYNMLKDKKLTEEELKEFLEKYNNTEVPEIKENNSSEVKAKRSSGRKSK